MRTWTAAGRLRAVGLAVGSLAGAAMIVVGCSNVTQGSAQGNASDAPDYRTSVEQSIEASSSSSVARESKRQEAAKIEAVHASCDAFVDGSKASIAAVNAYVGAFNQGAGGEGALIGPAVDSLNGGADKVAGSLSDVVPAPVSSALNQWVASARRLATVLPTSTGPDEFNAAVSQLEGDKDAAIDACKAAY